jgi:hypothetical protein
VAGFVIIGHGVGLVVEGAIQLTIEVGMFQGVSVGLGAVGRGARGEDHVIALANEALIEEGSK